MSTIKKQPRWDLYIDALTQFVEREGHALVPTAHEEMLRDSRVTLGSWVCYNRSKYRKGNLRADRCAQLSQFSGWEWGPLPAGPPSRTTRNQEIARLREEGSSLRTLADMFNLSRQRIQQIAGPLPTEEKEIRNENDIF